MSWWPRGQPPHAYWNGTLRLMLEGYGASARSSMAMKEISIKQIAAALGGQPGDPSVELRLLLLFQSDVADRVEVQPRAINEPVATGA